jgi:hypothetical protein
MRVSEYSISDLLEEIRNFEWFIRIAIGCCVLRATMFGSAIVRIIRILGV